MKPHPASQILTWCLLVAMLQVLAPRALMLASGLIMLCGLSVSRHKFILLLQRTRWVMLSLLTVYACSTPGKALFDQFGNFGPTHEGLEDGVTQLMRLLAALAALAILLEHLHRQQLIAGLYTLLAPLQRLGVSRERLAVRLALTLHYAEVAMLRGKSDWKATIHSLFESREEPVRHMELSLYRFGVGDMALLLAAVILIGLALQ